jgi:hypothetical protein
MIRHHVLTLTGSAQRLSTVTGAELPKIRTVSIQPAGANANPSYIGASGVSSTDYGVRMEAGAAGVPPAPFVLGEFANGWASLDDFYVIGTNTEKLHILVDYLV